MASRKLRPALKAAIESSLKWRVALPQYLQTVDLGV